MIFHERGYLPHIELRNRRYFVTFRLADSLPAGLLRAWKLEREIEMKSLQQRNGEIPEDEILRLKYLFSDRVEQYLDSGIGECWLKQPKIAQLVVNALRYFDGSRYRLHCWCVMPNHVHVLFAPKVRPGTEKLDSLLIPILHSWKSFTSNQANRILHRHGKFWQEEYFDVLVRSERQFGFYVRYILENPVKAGLCMRWQDWKWSGCDEEIRSRISE